MEILKGRDNYGSNITNNFFYIFIACYVFYYSVKAAIMNFKSHKYKGRTVGKIIKVCEHVSWYKFSKRIYYYPIYSYTVEGITYEEKFPFYETSSSILPIGKDNILLYDKKNPRNFIPIGKENVWFKQSFIGFCCILFWIIITILIFYKVD